MRKWYILAAVLSSITIITGFIFAQNTINVVVQGISDGIRNTKQIDRDEAIMDAKLKAIEQAGVDITSVTTIENFQLKKDWIESKAKASILPGFQIVEVGYAADGLYHVVLSCKVTTASKSAQPNDNPAGIEFVFVKGGTFQMGETFEDGEADEKSVHPVTVSDFYIGKTEVTVAQYRVFCNAICSKLGLEG
jgi:formylglycine-generating enzyme required for sulfatase activity